MSKRLLTKFDEPTQKLLKEVDLACKVQVEKMREEANKASLAGKELEIDMETMVWVRIIKAYGVLYNRAVDAGWIDDIMLEEVR